MDMFKGGKLRRNLYGRAIAALLLLVALLASAPMPAQTPAPNKRLILKDGSYQVVTRYEVKGDRVRYISAERGGEWEELPANLIDWPATERWAKEHVPGARVTSPDASEAAAIDKEERQERAEQDARMPQVAPGLQLPDEDGVWVLDSFEDKPELVGLYQNTGDVNRQLGHNVLRSAVNPLAGSKQSIRLQGARSQIRLHVAEPVVYVSLDTDEAPVTNPDAVTVDTHGLGSKKDKNSFSSPSSRYAIVKVQSRRDYRSVGAITISALGKVSQSEDAIPTTAEILPGRHWMKLTPKQPLTIGDYALMEILGAGEVNLSVWDFRIDPEAPENKNAILPLQRR